MNFKVKKKLVVLYCLFMLPLGIAQVSNGQTVENDFLDRRINELVLNEINFRDALAEVANAYSAPIGFEISPDNFSKDISLRLENKTLREALTLIVGKKSGYDWTATNGEIYVFPTKERDEFLEDLLQTQIKHFSLGRNPSVMLTKSEIFTSPAIKMKLENNSLTPLAAPFVERDFHGLGKDFILIGATNKSLFEILNVIIKESNTKFWALNRAGNDKEFIVINF